MEGIVAKRADSNYRTTASPSKDWLKIKNRNYSQAKGREELFNRESVPGSPRGRQHPYNVRIGTGYMTFDRTKDPAAADSLTDFDSKLTIRRLPDRWR